MFKTKVVIEILSEKKIKGVLRFPAESKVELLSLCIDQIRYHLDDGNWSGSISVGESEPVAQQDRDAMLLEHGSDPVMFGRYC